MILTESGKMPKLTKAQARRRAQECVGKLVLLMNCQHLTDAQSKKCYEMSRYMTNLASKLK